MLCRMAVAGQFDTDKKRIYEHAFKEGNPSTVTVNLVAQLLPLGACSFLFDTKMIGGGYILQPRSWDSSKAAHFPPVVREVWHYLLRQVNHNDNELNKRGERYFSLDEIQKSLSWSVGYRVMKYSKPQLTKALRRLREENMIATPKATHGVHITVINYDYYQTPENYEGNGEGNAKATRRKSKGNANKNEKNERMKEEEEELPIVSVTRKAVTAPDKKETSAFFLENGSTNEEAAKYWYHYDANGWMCGKVKMRNWKSAARKWIVNSKTIYLNGNGHSKANGKLGYQKPITPEDIPGIMQSIAEDDRYA